MLKQLLLVSILVITLPSIVFAQSFDELNTDDTVIAHSNPTSIQLPNTIIEEKIDVGFLDDLKEKIKMTEPQVYGASGDIIEEYHNVIIVVNKTDDVQSNKEFLVNMLKDIGAKNIRPAKHLSFITADIPLSKIPYITAYAQIIQLGDGEQIVKPMIDKARETIKATNQDIRQIHNTDLTGDGVIISIVDNGINSIYLNDKITKRVYCPDDDCVVNNGIITGNITRDKIGFLNNTITTHGTDVAQIIAASGKNKNNGIAPGVTLLDAQTLVLILQSPFISDYLHSIDWSFDNNADILNLSFGGIVKSCPRFSSSQIILNEAVLKGMTIVQAAGNENYKKLDSLLMEACAKSVITVGGINDRDDTITMYVNSSRGPTNDYRPIMKPDLVAPAVDIESSISSINNVPAYISGTSFATPFVTGTAALMLEADPTLTPLEIKTLLLLGANWTGPVPCTSSQFEQNNPNDNCSWAKQLDKHDPKSHSINIVNNVGFGILDAQKSINYTLNSDTHMISDSIDEKGHIKKYTIDITDTSKPVKIILGYFPIEYDPYNIKFNVKCESGQTINATSVYQTNEFVVFNPTSVGSCDIFVSYDLNNLNSRLLKHKTGTQPFTITSSVPIHNHGGIPKADDITFFVKSGQPLIIPIKASDFDNDRIIFTVSKQPTQGTLSDIKYTSDNTAQIMYTPFSNFTGTDTVQLTPYDGTNYGEPATYTLNQEILPQGAKDIEPSIVNISECTRYMFGNHNASGTHFDLNLNTHNIEAIYMNSENLIGFRLTIVEPNTFNGYEISIPINGERLIKFPSLDVFTAPGVELFGLYDEIKNGSIIVGFIIKDDKPHERCKLTTKSSNTVLFDTTSRTIDLNAYADNKIKIDTYASQGQTSYFINDKADITIYRDTEITDKIFTSSDDRYCYVGDLRVGSSIPNIDVPVSFTTGLYLQFRNATDTERCDQSPYIDLDGKLDLTREVYVQFNNIQGQKPFYYIEKEQLPIEIPKCTTSMLNIENNTLKGDTKICYINDRKDITIISKFLTVFGVTSNKIPVIEPTIETPITSLPITISGNIIDYTDYINTINDTTPQIYDISSINNIFNIMPHCSTDIQQFNHDINMTKNGILLTYVINNDQASNNNLKTLLILDDSSTIKTLSIDLIQSSRNLTHTIYTSIIPNNILVNDNMISAYIISTSDSIYKKGIFTNNTVNSPIFYHENVIESSQRLFMSLPPTSSVSFVNGTNIGITDTVFVPSTNNVRLSDDVLCKYATITPNNIADIFDISPIISTNTTSGINFTYKFQSKTPDKLYYIITDSNNNTIYGNNIDTITRNYNLTIPILQVGTYDITIYGTKNNIIQGLHMDSYKYNPPVVIQPRPPVETPDEPEPKPTIPDTPIIIHPDDNDGGNNNNNDNNNNNNNNNNDDSLPILTIIIPYHDMFDTRDRTIDLYTDNPNTVRIDTWYSDKGTKYHINDKADITIFRDNMITGKTFNAHTKNYCYVGDLQVGQNNDISTQHTNTLNINFKESTEPDRCGDHPNIDLDGKLVLQDEVYVRFADALGQAPFYYTDSMTKIPKCKTGNFDATTNTLKGNTKICYGKSDNDIILVSKILAIFGVMNTETSNVPTPVVPEPIIIPGNIINHNDYINIVNGTNPQTYTISNINNIFRIIPQCVNTINQVDYTTLLTSNGITITYTIDNNRVSDGLRTLVILDDSSTIKTLSIDLIQSSQNSTHTIYSSIIPNSIFNNIDNLSITSYITSTSNNILKTGIFSNSTTGSPLYYHDGISESNTRQFMKLPDTVNTVQFVNGNNVGVIDTVYTPNNNNVTLSDDILCRYTTDINPNNIADIFDIQVNDISNTTAGIEFSLEFTSTIPEQIYWFIIDSDNNIMSGINNTVTTNYNFTIPISTNDDYSITLYGKTQDKIQGIHSDSYKFVKVVHESPIQPVIPNPPIEIDTTPTPINPSSLLTIIIPESMEFDTSDITLDLNTYSTNKIRIDTYDPNLGTRYFINDQADITIFRNTEITGKTFNYGTDQYCYSGDLRVGTIPGITLPITNISNVLYVQFREHSPDRCDQSPDIDLTGNLDLDTNIYVRFSNAVGLNPFYSNGTSISPIPKCDITNFDDTTNTLNNINTCYGKSGNDIIIVSKVLSIFGVTNSSINTPDQFKTPIVETIPNPPKQPIVPVKPDPVTIDPKITQNAQTYQIYNSKIDKNTFTSQNNDQTLYLALPKCNNNVEKLNNNKYTISMTSNKDIIVDFELNEDFTNGKAFIIVRDDERIFKSISIDATMTGSNTYKITIPNTLFDITNEHLAVLLYLYKSSNIINIKGIYSTDSSGSPLYYYYNNKSNPITIQLPNNINNTSFELGKIKGLTGKVYVPQDKTTNKIITLSDNMLCKVATLKTQTIAKIFELGMTVTNSTNGLEFMYKFSNNMYMSGDKTVKEQKPNQLSWIITDSDDNTETGNTGNNKIKKAKPFTFTIPITTSGVYDVMIYGHSPNGKILGIFTDSYTFSNIIPNIPDEDDDSLPIIPITIPNHETFDTSDRTIDLYTYGTNQIRIDSYYPDTGTRYYINDKADITIFRDNMITGKTFNAHTKNYCYVGDLQVGQNNDISTQHTNTLNINFKESTEPDRCGDHPNIDLDGKLVLQDEVYVRFADALGQAPFYYTDSMTKIPKCKTGNFDATTNTLKGNTKICYGKSDNDIILVSKILAIFGVMNTETSNVPTPVVPDPPKQPIQPEPVVPDPEPVIPDPVVEIITITLPDSYEFDNTDRTIDINTYADNKIRIDTYYAEGYTKYYINDIGDISIKRLDVNTEITNKKFTFGENNFCYVADLRVGSSINGVSIPTTFTNALYLQFREHSDERCGDTAPDITLNDKLVLSEEVYIRFDNTQAQPFYYIESSPNTVDIPPCSNDNFDNSDNTLKGNTEICYGNNDNGIVIVSKILAIFGV